MSPPVVRRRRRDKPARRRVVDGWVDALEKLDEELRGDGSTAWLHRTECRAPEGPCDCQVVFVGPAVRAFPS